MLCSLGVKGGRGKTPPPRGARKTQVAGDTSLAGTGQEGRSPVPKHAQVGITSGQQPEQLGSS